MRMISILNLVSIILVGITLITIAYVLYALNRTLDKKVKKEKIKYREFKKRIKKLKNSKGNNYTQFKELSKIAKDFFKQYYKLNKNLTYRELSKIFEKKKRPEYSEFCKLMSDLNYSGREIPKTKITKVINLFEKISKKSNL